jgi:hypothetical protein
MSVEKERGAGNFVLSKIKCFLWSGLANCLPVIETEHEC